MKSKKSYEFLETWVELFFFVLLVIAFIISVSLGSAFFTYIVILLLGLMAGRFLQKRKKQFPFYLVILGGLIGFVLGTRYANWKVTVFLFIVGVSISFYVHEKGYLK
jgi:hypothetical protein